MLFAGYGNQITCLEPGERLAAIAEQNLRAFHNVQIVRSKFEDWPGQEDAFDLMISAQAFHWLERDVAFAKGAKLLKSTGARDWYEIDKGNLNKSLNRSGGCAYVSGRVAD